MMKIVRSHTAQAFHILFTHPDKEETLETVNEFYDELEDMAQKTPATLHTKEIDIRSYFDNKITRNLFLEILLPAISRVVELSYRNQVDSYATLTTLATFEYQKKYDHFPDSLDELVQKQILKGVPIDPFSNKPIVYRRKEDSFILYSVGHNFTDDGGTPATDKDGKPRRWGDNGDWIFWPIQKD